jgi:hypothetical protein
MHNDTQLVTRRQSRSDGTQNMGASLPQAANGRFVAMISRPRTSGVGRVLPDFLPGAGHSKFYLVPWSLCDQIPDYMPNRQESPQERPTI